MPEYISREALRSRVDEIIKTNHLRPDYAWFTPNGVKVLALEIPTADVRPVSEIEKIIESLQEQADIYNARAQELLVEEDGQVSQYTWAVSLRETYRRIIKTLDDLIS